MEREKLEISKKKNKFSYKYIVRNIKFINVCKRGLDFAETRKFKESRLEGVFWQVSGTSKED